MSSEYTIMYYHLSFEQIEDKTRTAFTDITCFNDRDTAIQVVHESLKNHSETIARWLMEEPNNRRIRLETNHGQSIGYGISKRTNQKHNHLSKSFIILERTAFQEEGFRIIFTGPLIEQ